MTPLVRTALVLSAFVLSVAIPAFGAEVPANWRHAWPDTDFETLLVDPAEILSGGPPKDGIPAITGPTMIEATSEDALDAREPVMVLALASARPRAYPVRYLMWHEIVNDTVTGTTGEIPVAVTFCPLCNSGLVFDRRLDGQVLEFGVTGKLRYSDMIMYDRQTESWWQQFNGTSIVGSLAGRKLTTLPALMLGWQSFREAHPDGLVMAEPDRYSRPYGQNPYTSYDSGRPFLYRGEMPPEGIPPTSRVVRVGARAWPLIRLAEAGELTEAGMTLSWQKGQASALDTRRIADGREVGDIRVIDATTGEPVAFEVVFAFAFQAFHPDGEWMRGQ